MSNITRDYLYKYYTVDSAISTLENCNRKWSNPIKFNDPFDNQFDFKLTGSLEEVKTAVKYRIIKQLYGDSSFPEIKNIKVFNVIEQYKQMPESNQKIILQKLIEEPNEFLGHLTENEIVKSTKQFNDKIKKSLSGLLIFCLSETKDNLLMWAHYTKNHEGLVIKFKNYSKDSPLQFAQKVIYTNEIPSFSKFDIISNEIPPKQIKNIYTLTKSVHWSYEREWRIIGRSEDKYKTFEILDFAPEEIADIYLGLRIEPEKKDKIIEIVKNKYPQAGIYQAYKDKEKYGLVFETI